METIPCPGCRTELGPEVTACPICTRPRSKYEITRAYATLRAMQAKQRKRPFIVAAYLLALGAAGGLAYKFQAPLLKNAAAGRARLSRLVDEATDPNRLSAHPAAVSETPATSPLATTAPSPAAAPPALRSNAAAVDAPASTPPPAVIPVRQAARGDIPLGMMDPAIQWGLRGRVYDLLTLSPVPMISLMIRGSNGMVEGITTDADGRYMVILPRSAQGGYEILSSAPGYAASVFYESDIPYAHLSTSERKDLAESALSGDVHPTPITDIIGEEAIHRDVFVVPRR